MTKDYKIAVLFLFSTLGVFSQDIYFDKIAWTGDWLPLSENIMVKGEGFFGYPGPLAKLSMTGLMGLSPNACDYEERYLVDATAPHWYGNCDGWAAASILFDDPEAVVTNGMKLMQPEMRALLSVTRSDDNIIPFGAGGLTARGFNSIVETFLMRGNNIILDMGNGDEKWNYPVSGYAMSRGSDGNGNQLVTVKLILTLPMSMSAQLELTLVPFYIVDVKYTISGDDEYEWVSDTYPEFAWLPGVPYFISRWDLHSNRFLTYENVKAFMDASSEDVYSNVDYQEPNGEISQAFQLKNQITLGCTRDGDADYYSFRVVGGLPESVELVNYSGSSVVWELLNPTTGEVLLNGEGNTEIASSDLVDGEYVLHLTSGSAEPSFYIVRLPDNSMYLQDERMGVVVNFSEKSIPYQNGEKTSTLAPFGSISTKEVVVEGCKPYFDSTIVQFYGLEDEATTPYYSRELQNSTTRYFPHIAHLYGWETELRIHGDTPIMNFELTIYDKDGDEVRKERFFVEGGVGVYPVSTFVNKTLPPVGYWFSLREVDGRKFQSEVEFYQTGLNQVISYALNDYRECFGEFYVSQIYSAETGWNGLAIVNTSEVENQIMYKVIDKNGYEKTKGSFFLEPRQKHLNLALNLLDGYQPEQGDYLNMFSQYPIVGIEVHASYNESIVSGDFFISKLIDMKECSVWPFQENGSFEVINRTNRFQHVLFSAYDSNGNRLGRFNTELGNPLAAYSSGVFSMSQILENGIVEGDLANISHFMVKMPEEVYVQYYKTRHNADRKYVSKSPLPYLKLDESIIAKNKTRTYDVMELIK
ncbi:MAG: hypothetical protein CR997_07945 [Acidobacteria bacterium]|nr:MAG: hypothetical protein CR997_07945 [Acidobacteriota bacterium]